MASKKKVALAFILIILLGSVLMDAVPQSISLGKTLYATVDSDGTFGDAASWWVAEISLKSGEENYINYAITPSGESGADSAGLTLISPGAYCNYKLVNRNDNYQVLGIVYYELGSPERAMPVILRVTQNGETTEKFMNAANIGDRWEEGVEIKDVDGKGRLIIRSEGLHVGAADCAAPNNVVVLIKDGGEVLVADEGDFELALPFLAACKIQQFTNPFALILGIETCGYYNQFIEDAEMPASWRSETDNVIITRDEQSIRYAKDIGAAQIRVYANADYFDMEPVAGETKSIEPKILEVETETIEEKSSAYVRVTIENPAEYAQSIQLRGAAEGGSFGPAENYAFGPGEVHTLTLLYSAPTTTSTTTFRNTVWACVANVLTKECDTKRFNQEVTELEAPPIIPEPCPADYANNPGQASWDEDDCVWVCNEGYAGVYDTVTGKIVCMPNGEPPIEGEEFPWVLIVGGLLLLVVGLVYFGYIGKGGFKL